MGEKIKASKVFNPIDEALCAAVGHLHDFSDLLSMADRFQVLPPVQHSSSLNLPNRRILHGHTQTHSAQECPVPNLPPEVQGTNIEILDRLAAAAECRDESTGKHIRRIGE